MLLRRLTADGVSARDASTALRHAGFDFSRSAVIGKRARLAIGPGNKEPAKAPRVRKLRGRPRVHKARATPPVLIKLPPAPPQALNLKLAQLEPQHCRFPTTPDPPYLYCGAPATHLCYCAWHYRYMHGDGDAASD